MLDKIKQIKYSRLKEEERFFLETIDGIEPFKSDKYPQSIFLKKNGVVLLEQDYENGWLRVNYELIWSVFEDKYGYNYNDTQSFIKDAVERHTNLESLTPVSAIHCNSNRVERHTNLESLTPEAQSTILPIVVERHTNLITSSNDR